MIHDEGINQAHLAEKSNHGHCESTRDACDTVGNIVPAHICTHLHIFLHIRTFLHILATVFFHCVSSHWPLTPPQPVDKGFNYDQGHHVWHCLRVIFASISDKKHPRHSLNHHYHGLVLVGLSCRIRLSSIARPSLTIFTMRAFTCWT